jgi:hypothetical protein
VEIQTAAYGAFIRVYPETVYLLRPRGVHRTWYSNTGNENVHTRLYRAISWKLSLALSISLAFVQTSSRPPF